MRDAYKRASVAVERALDDRGRRALILAGLVLLAALYHWLQARGRATPWIFPDELRYAEFERALAGTGRFGMIESLEIDGILHVAVLSPAWLLNTTADSFEGVQALNAVAFALTAIPVYLMARRVGGPLPALLVAAAAVVIPAAFYASTLMQEPLAYPVATTAALLIVRAVERPGARTLLAAATVSAAGFLVRGQLGAMLAAASLALLIDSGATVLRGGRPPIPPRWAVVVAVAGVAIVAVTWATVGSVGSALDGVVGDPRQAASVAIESLGVTAIAVAVAPLVAATLLLRDLGGSDRPRAALAATVLAVTVTMVAYTVAKSASLDFLSITRVEERNLIYLEPLFLVAILAVAGRVGWQAIAAASAAVALLVATLPLSSIAISPILSEAPGMSWIFFEGRTSTGIAWWVIAALTVAAVAGGAALRRRELAVPLVAFLGVGLIVAGTYTYRGDHQIAGEFAERFVPADPQWLDTAADGDRVAVLLTPDAAEVNRTWTMAFWNRSIWSYAVADIAATGLAVRPTTVGPEGLFSTRGADLVLHPSTAALGESTGVAESIWRLSDARGAVTEATPLIQPGLVRIAAWVTGRSPDGWVGERFTIQRFVQQDSGDLNIALSGENPHVSTARTVTARADDSTVVRAGVRPGTVTIVAVPVPETPFRVDVEVQPALSPGPADPRLLSLQLIGVEVPGVGNL